MSLLGSLGLDPRDSLLGRNGQNPYQIGGDGWAQGGENVTQGQAAAPGAAPILPPTTYNGIQTSYQPDNSGLTTQLQPVGSASATYAALNRQQWADYVNRFVPVENNLISYALSPEVVNANMASAGKYVDQAYAAQPAMQQRNLAGFGIQLTPDQQQASDRETNLSHGLANVQAQNTARDATVNRQLSVVSGTQQPNITAPQGV